MKDYNSIAKSIIKNKITDDFRDFYEVWDDALDSYLENRPHSYNRKEQFEAFSSQITMLLDSIQSEIMAKYNLSEDEFKKEIRDCLPDILAYEFVYDLEKCLEEEGVGINFSALEGMYKPKYPSWWKD